MIADLSNFKVVYRDTVLNALTLDFLEFPEDKIPGATSESIFKPKFITMLAINTDGNIVAISDEAWMFQFIPKVKGVE